MLRSEKNNILLLDAGGNFVPNPNARDARIKAQVTMRSMNIMEYDAMNLGPHELALGNDYLQEAAEVADFPFIASNLDFGNHRPAWAKEYLLKPVGSIRVLVLGVMPQISDDNAPALLKSDAAIKVIQPKMAVSRILKQMQDKADLTVLLSQLSLDSTCALVDSVKGIDVAIFSGTREKGAELRTNPQTPVFATGSKGLLLGSIQLFLRSDNKMAIAASDYLVLGGSVPTDERINELIRNKETWFQEQQHKKLRKDLELSPHEFFEKLRKGFVQ